MDKKEAKEILSQQIAKLRKMPYAELCKYVEIKNVETFEVEGTSGKKYQLEIQAVWDSGRPKGDLRVIVAIDDGGWRAFCPITDNFIISPDGSFVGE